MSAPKNNSRPIDEPPNIIKEDQLIVGNLYRFDFTNLFIKCKDHLEDVSLAIRECHGHTVLLCEIADKKVPGPFGVPETELAVENEYRFLSGETMQYMTYFQLGPWLRPAKYKSNNKKYWDGPFPAKETL